MNVAMRTELETAFTEGRMTTFTIPNGLVVEVCFNRPNTPQRLYIFVGYGYLPNQWVLLQIPAGARYIGIPGTESPHYPQGLVVEVYWQQDPLTGKLCMAGHSAKIAVPPNFQRLPSLTSTTPPNTLGKGGTVKGIVVSY